MQLFQLLLVSLSTGLGFGMVFGLALEILRTMDGLWRTAPDTNTHRQTNRKQIDRQAQTDKQKTDRQTHTDRQTDNR